MEQTLKEALAVLRGGGVILYPTDTVWGLGCDASCQAAVARVFAIKRRSDAKSLVLLASDADMVAKYVKAIPEMALQLIEINDRPMTLVYPGALRANLAEGTVAEDGSVGIRISQNDFCRALAYRLGHLLVSTSANVSGQPTPKVFAEIPQEIKGAVDYIVDPSLEAASTGQASQIIKVEMDGRVQVIRA